MAYRISSSPRTIRLPESKLLKQVQRLMVNSAEMRKIIYAVVILAATGLIVLGSAVIGLTNLGVFVVGGIGVMIVGVIMVVRPDIGMFVLVASVYTNSSDVLEVSFGIPDTNKLLVALTFVSVIGTRAIIQNKPLRFGSTEMAIAIYMVVAVLSLFMVGEVGTAFDQVVGFAKDFAIVLIIVQLCGDEITWKRMQWVLVGCATVLGTMTTYQGLTGNYAFEFWGYANAPTHEVVQGQDGARPTGPLDDPNYFSQMILMSMPIAFYRMFTEDKKSLKYVAGFCWLMIMGAAILTYSRAAFLAIIFIMVVIVYERKMNPIKVGLGTAMFIIIISPFLPQGYWDRINTLTGVFASEDDNSKDSSFSGRTSEALAALMMFADHPLTGVGYGLYEENYLEYSIILGIDGRLEQRAAHSIYLEVIAETAILGILSFGGMVATFYYVTQQSIPKLVRIGRADLIPWIRGVQFGFMSYLFTSIFLHDDWVRFFRLGLAIMASSSVVADTILEEHAQQERIEAASKRAS